MQGYFDSKRILTEGGYLLQVIATDDTSLKVLDRRLPFARIGRMWPYVGDAHHPVIVYNYTATRSSAGPAKFLEDC